MRILLKFNHFSSKSKNPRWSIKKTVVIWLLYYLNITISDPRWIWREANLKVKQLIHLNKELIEWIVNKWISIAAGKERVVGWVSGGEDAGGSGSCRHLSVGSNTTHRLAVPGHRHRGGHHEPLAHHWGEHAEPSLQRHWRPGLPPQTYHLWSLHPLLQQSWVL